MFTSDVLTIERDGHVSTLWLDSPERRNAMGNALWRDLPLAMAELGGDRDVRCVVIAARGKSFTVGLDLKDASLLGSAGTSDADASGADSDSGAAGRPAPSSASQAFGRYKEVKRLQSSISSVAGCAVPVIAAVHGHCIGGGVDLITACDIRLCSTDAIFSVRETKIAIVADLGTLQRLPRIIPPGHVAELAFTGKDIDASRAREIGLVNDVYPDADATVAAARALAAEIAANSPMTVMGTKTVLRAGETRSVDEGLDFVAAWNAGMLVSNDLMEAMTAFMTKRPPEFTGT